MQKDFRDATDQLFIGISHEELAKALGVSVATIRQARLAEGATARRRPPDGWEAVVRHLARGKAEHFRKLADRLK